MTTMILLGLLQGGALFEQQWNGMERHRSLFSKRVLGIFTTDIIIDIVLPRSPARGKAEGGKRWIESRCVNNRYY